MVFIGQVLSYFVIEVLCYGTGKLAIVALSFGNFSCEPFDGKEDYGLVGKKIKSGRYAVSRIVTILVGLTVNMALVTIISLGWK